MALPIPAGQTVVLPPELRPLVQAALEEFFSANSVRGTDSAFASASAELRAEAVTAYLCGGRDAIAVGAEPAAASDRPPRRVLLTGCFDLMHAGHYNALRQAKAAFPGEEIVLVAGVHSDESILTAKGAPTVMNHAERVELTNGCRWVDEVVGDLPYAVPVSLLDRLGCDVCVHGDDLPQVPDGKGLFDEVMKANRLRIVKRTEGTSTTILIGRLLSMSQDHLQRASSSPILISKEARARSRSCSDVSAEEAKPHIEEASPVASPHVVPTPLWMLLPTMSRMALFFGGRQVKHGAAKRVVFVPGEWDLFHIGHLRFLEKAKALGDFVLVGCYDDALIHKKKGKNYPLQTLHERALNVLSCRHVDDVLLGAPWVVSKDLLTTLNVAVVATGRINEYADSAATRSDSDLGDPFKEPRDAGMLKVLESECSLTMDVIAERILQNTLQYVGRQQKKMQVEENYNDNKSFVAET